MELPTKVLMDNNRAKRSSPLHPIPLENVNLGREMEHIKMKHETSLIPASFLNYLYSTVHLIFPVHCVCSFQSTCFPILPLPFISMCHSSWTLLISLLPFYFPVFWTITIPLCAGSKSSPPLTHRLSCPFLSTAPTWKAPFFWCSCKEVVMMGHRGGERFKI